MFVHWAGLDAETGKEYISAEIGSSIQFDASESFACQLNGDINDFEILWDFDDGSSSTDMQTNHVFDSPGAYDATLQVKASDSQLHSGFMYDLTLYILRGRHTTSL